MTQPVQRYYDQNTRLFLRWGSAHGARAIHRALWPPGVTRLEDALEVSNQLILNEINALASRDSLAALALADLGCGVGGTLVSLLERLALPARALGVTISPVQARLGGQAAHRAGRAGTCLISTADYLALPAAADSFDLAYAIEAAVHAPDPAGFYAEVTRVLRPGGRLVMIDDFLGAKGTHTAAARRWLNAYREGWHTSGLTRAEQACALADAYSLKMLQTRDLTAQLRLRALPDRLARLLLALGSRLPIRHAILPSMLGSLALQQCLRNRWLAYRLLVFEKHS